MSYIGFREIPSDNSRELAAKTEHPVKAFGWAARDESGLLSPFKFSRRATGENDVMFTVLYCGICHTDLHTLKNEWGISSYPMVPGHEIVGVVTEVDARARREEGGPALAIRFPEPAVRQAAGRRNA